MSEQTEFETASDAYFQAQFQLSLADLLAPIDSSQPAGPWLRSTRYYGVISEARRQDDASLPMGAWAHEPKRADWRKAGWLCATTLAKQSKDLQLAAWLMEAQIHQSGMAGIGPGIYLMQRLCLDFWNDLHPAAGEDYLEYRANIFQWVNEKLLHAIRMVPLTAADGQRPFCWGDWEMARRQEQIRKAAQPGRYDKALPEDDADLSCSMISAAIAATPTEYHLAQRDALTLALAALDALKRSIDPLFGDETPDMHAIHGILQKILSLVAEELHKRGGR